MLFLVLIFVLAALGALIVALIGNAPTWAWVSIVLSVLAALALVFDWWRNRRAARAEEAAEASGESEEGETEAEAADETAAEKTAVAEPVDVDERQDADAEPVAAAPEQSATDLADKPDATSVDAIDPAVAAAPGERTELSEPISADTADTADTAGATGTIAAAGAGAIGASGTDADMPEGSAAAASIPEPGDPESTEVQPVVAGRAERRVELDDTEPDEEETDAADLLIVSELDTQVLVVDEYPRYHLFECSWLTGRDTIPIAVSEARDLGFTPCSRCGPDAALAEGVRKRRKKTGWSARG